jgi:hypothetical protein
MFGGPTVLFTVKGLLNDKKVRVTVNDSEIRGHSAVYDVHS